MILAALLALAQPGEDSDERLLRRERVAGWTVEEIAESDGGLLVRLLRSGDGYRIEHVAEYWRGNSGPVRGTTFEMGECVNADASVVRPRGERDSAAALRRMLEGFLAECAVTGRAAARVLAGLDPAFERFSILSRDARDATRAEARAIASYGSDGTRTRRRRGR